MIDTTARYKLESLFRDLEKPIKLWLLYEKKLVPDMESAEEVYQETCYRAVKKSEEGNSVNSGYLFTIAHNIAIDEYRRKKRERSEHMPEENEMSTQISEQRAESFEDLIGTKMDIRKAIEQLPTQYQRCLMLDVEKYSRPEIAKELGVKVSTVTEYLSRCRRELKRICQEQEPHIHQVPIEIEWSVKDKTIYLLEDIVGIVSKDNLEEAQKLGKREIKRNIYTLREGIVWRKDIGDRDIEERILNIYWREETFPTWAELSNAGFYYDHEVTKVFEKGLKEYKATNEEEERFYYEEVHRYYREIVKQSFIEQEYKPKEGTDRVIKALKRAITDYRLVNDCHLWED
jgi:RNA polymerase sigma-70 factor, ECF subfamily